MGTILIILAIADLTIGFLLLLLLVFYVWRKMPEATKHAGHPGWEWSHYYAQFRTDTYLWWRGRTRNLEVSETKGVGGEMGEEQVFERPWFRKALVRICRIFSA